MSWMEMLTDPQVWILLVTLSSIEIVLGIDNLVFISIAVSKLPHEEREKARKFGIAVACITRIALLLTLAWLAGLTHDLFRLFGQGVSVRDLVLILGGVFLVVKGAMEIRDLVAGEEEAEDIDAKPAASFMAVAVMLLAARPLGQFIDRNPTIKMLALAFIVLIGVYLVADGFELHIPKGYIYASMGFSALVEGLNLWAKRRARVRERME